MRVNISILIILILSFFNQTLAQNKDLVINNVKLFDGDSVFEDVTVIVQNGIVVSILKNSLNKLNQENSIDGSGFTLIPGLINAHAHTVKKKNLKESASSGVLCVLDMMLSPSLNYHKLKKISQKPKYSHFYSANNPVTVPNGHGTHWKIETLKSEDQTAVFVEDIISEGCDYIKIMLDHGYRQNKPTLSDSMLSITIRTAKEHSKLSVAHIGRYDDAILAAKLGVSGFAHIWLFDSTSIPQNEIDEIRKKNVFIIPTLYVYQRGIEVASDPTDMDYLKDEVLRLYNAGIPILAGTDPPNYGVNFGSDIIHELMLLNEAGIPELGVLKSATSNVSRSFHLGQIGFIKEGYTADFVLIKGNPIENIKDLYNIEGIWKGGQRITPHNKR